MIYEKNLDMSTENSNIDQPCTIDSISRCFSYSKGEFVFSEHGFHGSLLSNMMSGIRDLTFYNILDKERKPVKVTSIQLNRGDLHLAHCLDESNGDRWYIHTGYLAVLNNG